MDLYYDLGLNRLVRSLNDRGEVLTLTFRLDQTSDIRMRFIRANEVVALAEPAVGKFGLKEPGAYDDDFVVAQLPGVPEGTPETGWVKVEVGSDVYYKFAPQFTTDELYTLIGRDGTPGNDKPSVTLMGDIKWSEAGADGRTAVFTAIVTNIVIRDDEGLPPNPNPVWGSPVEYLKKAGNLAGLADVAEARENLGLGDVIPAVRVSPEVNSAPLVPLEGDLIGVSDSQGFGTNAAESGGRLPEAYRFFNIFAAAQGRSLDVSNFAVPGAKLSFYQSGASIWNSLGQVSASWEGVLLATLGYNSCDSSTVTPEYYDNFEETGRAFLARFLADGYAGISTAGWGATGSAGGTLHGFFTTGSNVSYAVSAGQSAVGGPLYYGDPDGAQRNVLLEAGEYAEWVFSGKKAVGILLATSATGGLCSVLVNGEERAVKSTKYVPLASANDPSGFSYPRVIWIDNLPETAEIRVAASGGSVLMQGYEWKDRVGEHDGLRNIIVAAVSGNQNGGRSPAMLAEMNRRLLGAVAAFGEYPIYFADILTGWDRNKYDEPTDASHFTRAGNQFVAECFERAGKPMRQFLTGKRPTVREVGVVLDDISIVNLSPSAWTGTVTNGGLFPQPSACISARSVDTANSSVHVRNNENGTVNPFGRPGDYYAYALWNKPLRIEALFVVTNTSANSVLRLNIGTDYSNTVIGNLSARGVGLKVENLALKCQIHDGTTLTVSAALLTLTAGTLYRAVWEVNGLGGVTLSINGTQVYAVTSGGPNAASSTCGIELSSTNGGDSAYAIINLMELKITKLPILE